MEKLFEKLFDIKRIPTKFIFVLWVSSGVVLFVPHDLLAKLNLTDFTKEYGKYLGITFIVTSALLCVTIVTAFFQNINRNKNKRRIEESILKSLKALDLHEKALLREFYIQGKSTLQLPFDNDTVAGLSNKGIIYQASATGFTYIHGVYFSYSITEFAARHLTHQAIELPQNPTEAEKQIILINRPQWAKERSRFDH